MLLLAGAVALAACAGGSRSTARSDPSTSSTRASTTTTTTTTPAAPPGLRRVDPPPGFATAGASWWSTTHPDGHDQLVAVFRPPGRTGPHPVVVALHGSSGLPRILLDWAPRLAASGVIVVTGCFLTPARGAPAGVFLPCPGLTDANGTTNDDLFVRAHALVDVGATLPGARPGPVGLFGISLGAMVGLSLDDPRVEAIAADSGYRTTPGTTATPVLLLGMTSDPNVDHAELVRFAADQAAAGKPVDAHYYPGTGHVTIFGPPPVSADATARITTFFQRLGGPRR